MESLQQTIKGRDANVKLARLQQHINTPQVKDKIVILVEGDTDIKLFNMVFKHDSLFYMSPQSGKPEVINSVSKIRSRVKNPIYGVVDADFDHLLGAAYNFVMLTDVHDSEMMMLHSDFMTSFLLEYLNTECIQENDIETLADTLISNILNVCRRIGVFKLINAKNDLKMNFKGINHVQAGVRFNKFEIEFDERMFLSYVIGRSERFDRAREQFVYSEYQQELDRDHCDYQVSNGHDFCGILSQLFKGEFSTRKNMTLKDVEIYLRSKYCNTKFKKTNLYTQLVNVIKKENGRLPVVPSLDTAM